MMPFVNHVALQSVVQLICEKAGSEPAEATSVSVNLVEANLMGHDSHGVGMLPRYVACIHNGSLKPNSHVKVVVDSGALLVIDGQRGYGQVIGREAMELAKERTQQYGVAIVALRNSFHLCRIGAWAEQCALVGFVSMHHTNVIGHKPLVAPFGSTKARYATNPYTVGLPATDQNPMMILDMATSAVALGKIRVARNKGETMKPGILLDSNGEPTINPDVMYEPPFGAVLPFGEHKGSGLGMVNELLAGILSGGHTMRPGTTPCDDQIINNMLSIVIDPSKLVDGNFYHSEFDETIKWIKSAQTDELEQSILTPGEPEQLSKAKRERDGIPIDLETWSELLKAGESVGANPSVVNKLAGIGKLK